MRYLQRVSRFSAETGSLHGVHSVQYQVRAEHIALIRLRPFGLLAGIGELLPSHVLARLEEV